ncbi:hypothetical protein [Brachyspira hampsonii]|uniref:hypothetical protein n=1 Tax=Brachyspira hampsonii TaxID=1287055 RepID=UPI000D3D4543|nr:hypothetical protein [Brachyspira hampsonii]PTY40815.1 hypothetical protein DQ06_09720 [Brachyspira hampsonii bv. II]
MIKKITLLLISLFLLSCSSPYSSSGLKFTSRNGVYENSERNISVEIKNQKTANLSIIVIQNSAIVISETLDVNPDSSANYMTIKSVAYPNYSYILNFWSNGKDMNITIKNDKNENIVFNKKLTRI